MLFLLRRVRKKLIAQNKFTTYLFYAIGEIVLVVVGILIAVTIDDRNQQLVEKAKQKQYYTGIITDLKRDSIHFEGVFSSFKQNLEYYYSIRNEIINEEETSPVMAYERMLYNRTFAPVTQTNHQTTIDKINDFEVRRLLNDYFARQVLTQTAIDEYNEIVVNKSRPYFLEKNTFNYDSVFHSDVYGFLPSGTLLKADRVRELLKDDRMSQLLTLLRISGGHILFELRKLKAQNAELISHLTTLQKK